jgi:hypothetical protein
MDVDFRPMLILIGREEIFWKEDKLTPDIRIQTLEELKI